MLLPEGGKNRDAIKEYQEALRWTRTMPSAHKALGSLYYRQTMLDESIVEFKKAIEMNPNYSDAHYELGVSLYRRGKMEEAIKSFHEALKINPNFHIARYWLGLSYYYIGKLTRVDRGVQKASIAKSPNISIAHYHLGAALAREEKYKESIEQFETFVKRSSRERGGTLSPRCQLLQRWDFERRSPVSRKPVEMDPSDERAKKNLAIA